MTHAFLLGKFNLFFNVSTRIVSCPLICVDAFDHRDTARFSGVNRYV